MTMKIFKDNDELKDFIKNNGNEYIDFEGYKVICKFDNINLISVSLIKPKNIDAGSIDAGNINVVINPLSLHKFITNK